MDQWSISSLCPRYYNISWWKKKDQKDEVWDRNSLFFAVPDGVMGVGDDGYRGEPNKIVTTRPEHSSEMKNFLGRAKNRQESLH